MKKQFALSAALLAITASPLVASAQDSASPAQEAEEGSDTLFGDFGGARKRLAENGVTIESILTYDSISNVHGGLKRQTAALGNYDLTASFDLEKLGGPAGGTVFLYALGNTGEAPQDNVGDTQASDNIQTDESFKLYEAWYEQSFADDRWSVLAGLHDFNSEFQTLEFAGNLINSSFGISVDVSQVGPSIFATTSLATRVRYRAESGMYAQGALYDGVPGDPNNPRGTHIDLRTDDGLFYALEAGFVGPEGPSYSKAALGGWWHTAEFEDFQGNVRDENGGAYFIAEKRLTAEEDENQGLGAFLQVGFASPSRNQIGSYFGGGLQYVGPIPSRDEDAVSFGVAHARNSGDFVDTSEEFSRAETAIELNYKASIVPWFALTGDIQYIVDPGTVDGVENATVLGIRAEVAM
ncbi:MAG: carbohydrate porin [Deltaproteobacteria bacterium]|nr:carbohydrate porin [Deltaproteobacteria bacterium]